MQVIFPIGSLFALTLFFYHCLRHFREPLNGVDHQRHRERTNPGVSGVGFAWRQQVEKQGYQTVLLKMPGDESASRDYHLLHYYGRDASAEWIGGREGGL